MTRRLLALHAFVEKGGFAASKAGRGVMSIPALPKVAYDEGNRLSLLLVRLIWDRKASRLACLALGDSARSRTISSADLPLSLAAASASPSVQPPQAYAW